MLKENLENVEQKIQAACERSELRSEKPVKKAVGIRKK